MNDRELLAAAALACEREIWDRLHQHQRTHARRRRRHAALSAAFPRSGAGARRRHRRRPSAVYGLIRQESRFILDARSGVGASGLM
ncbi:MAG: hypothetical protein U1F67_03200 [Rubrivivax sp.]